MALMTSDPTHGWTSTEAALEAILSAGPRRALVVAHDLPGPFNRPGLALSFVGPLARLPALRVESAHLFDCQHPQDVPARLRAATGLPPHELFFLDWDHAATSFMGQIAAALPLLAEDALWLFDDAVPPEPAMATARPREGWWTGQVYALPSLLRPEAPHADALLLATPPTGLAVFRGWRPWPADELRLRITGLPQAPDAAGIAALAGLPPRPPGAAIAGLDAQGEPALDVTGEAGRRVILALQPEQDWLRPAAAGVVQARPAPLPEADFGPLPMQVHGAALVEFDGVTVVGFEALFRGQALHGRYSAPWVRAALAEQLLRDGAWGNPPQAVLRRDEHGRIIPNNTALAPRQMIEEPVLWGTPDEGSNWGMWLLFVIASAELFHRNRRRYAKFLCWCPQPWQRAVLATLGITDDLLLEHEGGLPLHVRRLGLLQQTRRDLVVTPWLRGCLARFLAARGIVSAPAARRLYISRQGITRRGAYRGLMEEDALAQAMAARGFEVVEPETMPLAEQAALFHQAAVVVGPGGAGLFNCVFCQPGARVVTLEGTLEFAPWHANLFASCGLEYGVVLGEEDAADPSAHQKRWRLDLPVALAGIDAMLAGWGVEPVTTGVAPP